MNPPNRSACAANGFTLVEVMLSIAILAILAFLAVSGFFYPHYLVVTSGLEQSAIHAAGAELERHLDNYQNPVPSGVFNADGWTFTVTTTTNLVVEVVPGTSDTAGYVEISTVIEYRDGKTIDLITYRSNEISPSERHP
jgi:prepilin-type N-terminal cleavage/methylation domain-containing protein